MANADNGRLSERDQTIWDGHVGGKTILMLAKEHDLSNQRISQILAEIRASLPPRDRQTVVDLRLDQIGNGVDGVMAGVIAGDRTEEQTSELQSLMRITYAVFSLKINTNKHN